MDEIDNVADDVVENVDVGMASPKTFAILNFNKLLLSAQQSLFPPPDISPQHQVVEVEVPSQGITATSFAF